MGLKTEFIDIEISEEEKDLYSRQFDLGGWSQKIIKNSRVLIVGVGGVGCEVAKNLARIGVGYLDLVDLDIIERSNLSRQVLYKPGDEGRPKVKVATERLKEINPFITVKGYYTSLEHLDPAIYKAADVIIAAIDTRRSRLNLNSHCIRFKKPFVEGGVGGYHGYVCSVFPFENACSIEIPRERIVRRRIPRKRIHCVFKAYSEFEKNKELTPDPENSEHINFILNYANNLVSTYDFFPLFTDKEVKKIISRSPQLITVITMISAMISHETIKILHWLNGNKSLGKPITSQHLFNAITMQLFPIEIKRNPNCSVCGDKVNRVNVKLKKNAHCEEIIQSLINMGFERDNHMKYPILTIMDFDGMKKINLDNTPIDNKLRNLELITAVGFKGGEIFINLELE
ncbi:MAG: ThiF family adenylyltransferase [Promethearchaeota archaeon]|nr:MAG: ThiF family adenylyltransferase [Candidatus Lokiarchaeota archaeon]